MVRHILFSFTPIYPQVRAMPLSIDYRANEHLRIEWASGNRGQDIPTWKGGQVVGSSIYHQISIVNPEGTETNDQMSDGTLYYAMPEVRVHVYLCSMIMLTLVAAIGSRRNMAGRRPDHRSSSVHQQWYTNEYSGNTRFSVYTLVRLTPSTKFCS